MEDDQLLLRVADRRHVGVCRFGIECISVYMNVEP